MYHVSARLIQVQSRSSPIQILDGALIPFSEFCTLATLVIERYQYLSEPQLAILVKNLLVTNTTSRVTVHLCADTIPEQILTIDLH